MHSPSHRRLSLRSAALTALVLALAACSPDSSNLPFSPARPRPDGGPLATTAVSHCVTITNSTICAIDITATAGTEFSGEVGTEALVSSDAAVADLCGVVLATDYTIDWGDGTTSPGTTLDCNFVQGHPQGTNDMTVSAPHTYTAGGSYILKLTHGANSASATATVSGSSGSGGGGGTGTGADVALSISGPSSAQRGVQVSYLITVSNAGPSSAHNVVMTAPVASGTSFVGVAVSQGTCAVTKGGSITCSLGDLASGGSAGSAVSVKVTAKVGGAVTYLASASSTTDGIGPATPDPNTSNNWASLSTTITK
jgi:uncharacterized repeat protein (TIGR01451 family)